MPEKLGCEEDAGIACQGRLLERSETWTAETTHGSQASSVSIAPEQGCHGAALAPCQSILASED